VISLLEVIQANPLNALEGQKAASLRNVRSTLLRLLDSNMPTMTEVLNTLLAQKINAKGVSDLQIVTESLENFSRKYKGEHEIKDSIQSCVTLCGCSHLFRRLSYHKNERSNNLNREQSLAKRESFFACDSAIYTR
jgi:hypothetical protein